ncbi:hypothetical protein H9N25_04625 [Pedobacter riviphilus]|uniref:Uncharacterized protein n=1 Tax=Pedobacter riviphilus TaxID=2766984 RepID=A0ABX6TLG6_9SPHI|nr:hypothetical protein [Pedobacter riviphilus]QNR85750.1 hypothetical protein H9N25_04625 [Pedobacter riviphilus]
MKEEIKEPQMIYVGKKLAYYSAFFGTMILIAYMISHAGFLIGLGLVYVLSAFVINGIFLLILLLELIYNTDYRRAYIVAIISMLLNIPLSFFYLFLVLHPIF